MTYETPVATAPPAQRAPAPERKEGGVLSQRRGMVVTVIMAVLALLWLFPLVWALINSFREYHRNLAELSQLSDRELADIGIDRTDIPRVASGSYNG